MVVKWNNGPRNSSGGFKLNKLNPEENIFHAIYILDNHTGALFASTKFSNQYHFSDASEDLISSFLNAMNMFINELNDEEEIQEINFKNMRILYERKDRLLVIAISKKTNLNVEKQYVHEIVNDFYFRFGPKISRFNGVVDPAMVNYKHRLKSFNLSQARAYNSTNSLLWE
ncbi:MAG: hypothetical protein JW891_01765 [Candidatus Lokiarchaeota archaeon]|nr:hypothetical protein [Candidatus Lokiarchaeota archaeon]